MIQQSKVKEVFVGTARAKEIIRTPLSNSNCFNIIQKKDVKKN